MYQVQLPDYNSPVQKRPRTGAKVEGDWTCPNCGNVNFAFRTTCNMRKCSTPKPTEGSAPLVTSMQPYNPPPIYEQPPMPQYVGGPGAPPPMPNYVQAGGYNSPMMSNPSAAPFSVAAHGVVAAYAPQGTYMPVMNGMQGPGYGAPPIDSYGMSRGPPVMDGPPLGRGPMSYNAPQDAMRNKRRGGPESGSDGDWTCPKCGNTNFAFRSVCNMRKCSEPKPAESAPPYQGGPPNPRFSGNGGPARPPPPQPAPPDGSWTCKACGNVNYPFRTQCNRRNCGVEKPTDTMAPGTAPSVQ